MAYCCNDAPLRSSLLFTPQRIEFYVGNLSPTEPEKVSRERRDEKEQNRERERERERERKREREIEREKEGERERERKREREREKERERERDIYREREREKGDDVREVFRMNRLCPTTPVYVLMTDSRTNSSREPNFRKPDDDDDDDQ